MIIDCFYHEKGIDELTNIPHTHENECEIIQPLSDGGNFIINSQAYPITSNSIFLINALDIHCSVPEKPQLYVRNKLVLNKHLLYKIILNLGNIELNNLLFNSSTKKMIFSQGSKALFNSIFANIFSDYKKDMKRHNYFRIYSNVFALFQKCIDVSSTSQADFSSQQYINAILKYIDNHLTENLTLENISTTFHINKSYLCRLFKRATNSTLMEYIKLQRIVNAKKMLTHSNASITEIALSCGFSSAAYFSNTFAIKEGISPSQYRAKYKNSKSSY